MSDTYEATYGSLRQDETFLMEVGHAAEMESWAESAPVNTDSTRTVEITSRANLAIRLAGIRLA